MLTVLAHEHCDDRLMTVLEGGYEEENLKKGTKAALNVLLRGRPWKKKEDRVFG